MRSLQNEVCLETEVVIGCRVLVPEKMVET